MRSTTGRLGMFMLGLAAATTGPDGHAYAQSAPPVPAPTAAEPTTLVLPNIDVSSDRVTARSPVKGYSAPVTATGTKTDTPILETPQAVTVITRDRLETLNARSISEALRYTAGVNADSYGSDVRGFYGSIRAFTPDIFLDGMRLPLTVTAQSYQIEPWGMERIEVIRGASSALYGSGNLGGIVNAMSKVARPDQVNQVNLQSGSFGRIQGAADIGGTLNGDGTLMWRFNGLIRKSDTSYDNIKNNRIFVAPSVTWKPDGRTTISLLSSYTQDDNGSSAQFLPASGTVLYNPAIRLAPNVLSGDRNYDVYSKRQAMVGYLAEHKVSDAWTLRQSMRFTHVDLNYRSIYGTGLVAGSNVLLNRAAALQQPNINTVTLDNQSETKFATGAVRHDLLLGVDYRTNMLANRTATVVGPQLNLARPVYLPVTYPVLSAANAISTNQTLNQVGAYAQDQLSLGDLRLTLTGRQDWANNDTLNNKTRVRTVIDNSKFTGRAALLYASPLGVSPYVSYATSFLPLSGTNFSGQPYMPQTGTQWEAGVKYQHPGSTLLLTAAVFNLRQQNVLTADPTNALNSIQTGEVRSRGLELEAVGEILPRLNLIATFTYQEPEVTRTTVAAQLGKRPVAQASRMASVWLDYTQPVSDTVALGVGGGARYTGNTAGDAVNSFSVPAIALLDLQARVDFQKWRLQVNGTNLTDRRYVAACSSIAACGFGTGRTVFATLGYRW